MNKNNHMLVVVAIILSMLTIIVCIVKCICRYINRNYFLTSFPIYWFIVRYIVICVFTLLIIWGLYYVLYKKYR